jgi:hypothetical protein
MTSKSFLPEAIVQLTRARAGRLRRNDGARRRLPRPAFDRLEERTLLSTWTVTDNSDNPTDTGSLRYAILNEPDGTTINFASTVGKSIMLAGSTLNITTNLHIEGPAGGLTINGNANGTSVFGIAAGKTVEMANLSITNGKSLSAGGIVNHGTLTLSDCGITGNVATDSTGVGGGIYNTGVLTLTQCSVTNNYARKKGGGIYNAGSGTLTVNGCNISNNSTLTLSSDYGGGGIYSEGKLTITDSTLSNNGSGNGGGIDNDAHETATVANCTLSYNQAQYHGGGLYNQNGTTLTCVNSTFAFNSAEYTGGIDNAFATVTMVNCTVAKNKSGAASGGVNNSGTTFYITNSIIAQNSVYESDGTGPDVKGSFRSQGYNLIGNTKASSGWIGTDLVNLSPGIGAFGNYGGPGDTFPLLPGSPAIDNGNNAVITSPLFLPPPITDERGVSRIINGRVDIGAFESRGFIITVSSGDNQAAKVGTVFSAPLVASVSSAYGEPVVGGYVGFLQAENKAAGCSFPGGSVYATIDATGRATISVAANTTAGSYPVMANTAGNFGASATFHMTNTPYAPRKLVLQTQPSPTATANDPFPVQPVVYVEDQYGNLETIDNSTKVTAFLGTGSGPLGGTTTITVTGGVAKFTDLFLATAETTFLVFLTENVVPALWAAVSSHIVVSPQVPYKLVLHTAPSDLATAGKPFAPQPVIEVVDKNGYLVVGDNSTQVTASIRLGKGPLLGTTKVTVSGGVATFGGGSAVPLQDNTAETIVLMFTSGKLLDAVSVIFVRPARASQLAIHTHVSATATAGSPFSRQPVIFVEDRYGNLVTSDNTTRVTALRRVGPGPLMGTTTVTASGGIATFTNLGDRNAGRVMLGFKSRGLVKALADRVLVKRASFARLGRLRAGRGVPLAQPWDFTADALES